MPAVDIPTMSVTHRVVAASPILDHDLGFLRCVGHFIVKQLIARLFVEALAIAIFLADCRA